MKKLQTKTTIHRNTEATNSFYMTLECGQAGGAFEVYESAPGVVGIILNNEEEILISAEQAGLIAGAIKTIANS